MAEALRIAGKKVTLNDRYVFVDERSTGLRQWEHEPTRWSNTSGRELTELRGNSLEQVLRIKGFL